MREGSVGYAGSLQEDVTTVFLNSNAGVFIETGRTYFRGEICGTEGKWFKLNFKIERIFT